MKKSIASIVFIFSLSGSLFVASCNNSETQEQKETLPPAEIKKDSTQSQASAYHCPMDCEGGNSDKAGKCGDCGMDLVERE